MDSRYTGPYAIVERRPKGLYKLAEVGNCDKVVEIVDGTYLKAYNTTPESEDRKQNVGLQ